MQNFTKDQIISVATYLAVSRKDRECRSVDDAFYNVFAILHAHDNMSKMLDEEMVNTIVAHRDELFEKFFPNKAASFSDFSELLRSKKKINEANKYLQDVK